MRAQARNAPRNGRKERDMRAQARNVPRNGRRERSSHESSSGGRSKEWQKGTSQEMAEADPKR